MTGKRGILFLVLAMIAGLLIAFNYYLWQRQNVKQKAIGSLGTQIEIHTQKNKTLAQRNEELQHVVSNLQSPQSFYAYEEKAREDYGMIGQNETFFVLPNKDLSTIPRIVGLADAENKGAFPIPKTGGEIMPSPASSTNTDTSPKTIAVTPVPSLQLESVQ